MDARDARRVRRAVEAELAGAGDARMAGAGDARPCACVFEGVVGYITNSRSLPLREPAAGGLWKLIVSILV